MDTRPYEYKPVGRDHVVSFHIDALHEMGVDVEALRQGGPVEPPIEPPTTPAIGPLDPEVVDWALAQRRLLRFNADLSGGAHCWDFAGELYALTHTSMISSRTDKLLLQNLKNLLLSENVPTCTGGFPDSKQLIATLSFFLAREMGMVASDLESDEVQRMALIAQAALVSGAWVMSDSNPHILAKEDETDMRGRWQGRDWNPNYTNGALGQVIFGTLWFGSDGAQDILLAHDHRLFRAALKRAGLGQIANTYETPTDDDGPGSPTDDAVNDCLHQTFMFHEAPLDPVGLLAAVLERTYNTNVSALRVVNPSAIGNLGELGQIHEFATTDAQGSRHSAHYSNDAWYQTLYLLHACLLSQGREELLVRLDPELLHMAIGSEDFLAKIHPDGGAGYHDFYKGQERGVYVWDETELGHHFHKDLYRVLKSALLTP